MTDNVSKINFTFEATDKKNAQTNEKKRNKNIHLFVYMVCKPQKMNNHKTWDFRFATVLMRMHIHKNNCN